MSFKNRFENFVDDPNKTMTAVSVLGSFAFGIASVTMPEARFYSIPVGIAYTIGGIAVARRNEQQPVIEQPVEKAIIIPFPEQRSA